jgi:hypothetical protein
MTNEQQSSNHIKTYFGIIFHYVNIMITVFG